MYEFAGAILIVLVVLFFIDLTTNGLSDCIDGPEYCKTVEDYQKHWPTYQLPKESLK